MQLSQEQLTYLKAMDVQPWFLREPAVVKINAPQVTYVAALIGEDKNLLLLADCCDAKELALLESIAKALSSKVELIPEFTMENNFQGTIFCFKPLALAGSTVQTLPYSLAQLLADKNAKAEVWGILKPFKQA